ncbi:MarR family transcriptional regulator [Neisseria sp. Ec49-e6-T10]|uniref:MarR family transcriptional regulator n=1 Tax=Neisseria sp. Ec49-e6-T10 TaxID=3140744 RepID=UPI003EBED9D0
MNTDTFSLTEQAVDQLAGCTPDAPVQRIKLVRLQHRLAILLSEHFTQSLKVLNVNQSEWLTLLFLYSVRDQRFSPSQLAKSLNCSRTNATRIIESLKQKDFILSTGDSLDKRKMQIALKQHAINFVEENLPEQYRCLNEIYDGAFTPEEEEAYRILSMKFLKYLEA